MAGRTIAQRELRNNIGKILRDAEAGTEFTITVRGRRVAKLGPADRPSQRVTDVDGVTVVKLLGDTPVDAGFANEVSKLRELEGPVDDPWQSA
jgi:prevent-host-death family protein